MIEQVHGDGAGQEGWVLENHFAEGNLSDGVGEPDGLVDVGLGGLPVWKGERLRDAQRGLGDLERGRAFRPGDEGDFPRPPDRSLMLNPRKADDVEDHRHAEGDDYVFGQSISAHTAFLGQRRGGVKQRAKLTASEFTNAIQSPAPIWALLLEPGLLRGWPEC